MWHGDKSRGHQLSRFSHVLQVIGDSAWALFREIHGSNIARLCYENE